MNRQKILDYICLACWISTVIMEVLPWSAATGLLLDYKNNVVAAIYVPGFSLAAFRSFNIGPAMAGICAIVSGFLVLLIEHSPDKYQSKRKTVTIISGLAFFFAALPLFVGGGNTSWIPWGGWLVMALTVIGFILSVILRGQQSIDE